MKRTDVTIGMKVIINNNPRDKETYTTTSLDNDKATIEFISDHGTHTSVADISSLDIAENVYTQNGYESRYDYLECLADEYDINLDTVLMLSDLLGPSEDFDGLVTSLQDM